MYQEHLLQAPGAVHRALTARRAPSLVLLSLIAVVVEGHPATPVVGVAAGATTLAVAVVQCWQGRRAAWRSGVAVEGL